MPVLGRATATCRRQEDSISHSNGTWTFNIKLKCYYVKIPQGNWSPTSGIVYGDNGTCNDRIKVTALDSAVCTVSRSDILFDTVICGDSKFRTMLSRALLLLLLSVTERSCPQQLSRVEERDIMQIILGRQGRYSVQYVFCLIICLSIGLNFSILLLRSFQNRHLCIPNKGNCALYY